MNLDKLFETQRLLDAEIEKKHPLKPEENRLAKRILALQVEVGELANEWRGFKFWSQNQSPRNLDSTCSREKADYYFCEVGKEEYSVAEVNNHGDFCYRHATDLMPMSKRNPLLEEYVDCLHFILSIGIELNFISYQRNDEYEKPKDTNDMFLMINEEIAFLSKAYRDTEPQVYLRIYYSVVFDALIALSEMLGFTWEQIEAAYMSKNKINHERQANGY